jgi:uncharacterized membrane protein
MEQKTRLLTTTAVMAALVFVVTLLVSIPVPGVRGAYFNVGDVVIYCFSFLLGGPYSVFAAAVGSALADVTLGAAVYLPATLVLKGCMALLVGYATLHNTSLHRYLLSCILAALIMAFGYCAYEFLLNGGWAAVLLTALPNFLQAGCGVGIAALLYHPMSLLRRRFALRPSPSC